MALDDNSEEHVQILDGFDFDHQILVEGLGGGEAMSMSGGMALAIMIEGHEIFDGHDVGDESQKWVFIVDDPMAMLRFWFSTGESLLKPETWAKVKAMLDE